MIYNETFDFLWAQMAGGLDKNATRRLKDYQRKRLCRALLGRALKPYILEASWLNTTGAVTEETVANTTPLTQPLMVADGAIRTTDIGGQGASDLNNFEILLARTGGNSRVQVSSVPIRDSHLLTPAQLGIKKVITTNLFGYGNCYPNTWPVPLELLPNELLQVRAKVLTGGVPAGETTFTQFRCVASDSEPGDDLLEADLRQSIAASSVQSPVYLSMFTEGFHSIAFPGTGANQITAAKTREIRDHLLVTGYATLFARATAGGNGSACDPKWRLTASNGWSFSKSEIDINTYAYAGPGLFWQRFPCPFLLSKGSSLSASFSTRGAITTQLERIENYVIFRCVTV